MDDGDACTQVGLADDGLERSAGSSCLLLPTCVLRLYTRVARCSDLEGAARGEAGSREEEAGGSRGSESVGFRRRTSTPAPRPCPRLGVPGRSTGTQVPEYAVSVRAGRRAVLRDTVVLVAGGSRATIRAEAERLPVLEARAVAVPGVRLGRPLGSALCCYHAAARPWSGAVQTRTVRWPVRTAVGCEAKQLVGDGPARRRSPARWSFAG